MHLQDAQAAGSLGTRSRVSLHERKCFCFSFTDSTRKKGFRPQAWSKPIHHPPEQLQQEACSMAPRNWATCLPGGGCRDGGGDRAV